MINFTIPIAPITKKNHQQIIYNKRLKRYMIVPSTQYIKYEKECKPFIPQEEINYAINIQAIFYMKTRRRVDLSNLLEALLDTLVKYKCIEDDNCNIVYSLNGSYVDYDKENPRTEVYITKLDDVITIKNK
jgi:Holliday junction resolvase RusA-like endonuclease